MRFEIKSNETDQAVGGYDDKGFRAIDIWLAITPCGSKKCFSLEEAIDEVTVAFIACAASKYTPSPLPRFIQDRKCGYVEVEISHDDGVKALEEIANSVRQRRVTDFS